MNTLTARNVARVNTINGRVFIKILEETAETVAGYQVRRVGETAKFKRVTREVPGSDQVQSFFYKVAKSAVLERF